ncbi:MAG: alpha/beta hydrolase [Bacillota bacterium]|nr:alpha/beta hydrolase [Bacillota bacterium]
MDFEQNARKFINSDHIGNYVDIGDISIHYLEAGEGDVLLLVHGIGQSLYTWRKNFYELAKSFRVIAIDLPGYGYSGRPDAAYTIEENSQFIEGFLNTLQIKTCHIAAFGSGALYALYFMYSNPKRVKRAIVIAPGGLTASCPQQVRMLGGKMMGRMSAMMINERTVRTLLEGCYFDRTLISNDDVREYYLPINDTVSKEAILRSVSNLNMGTVMDVLRDVEQKVLIMWGKDDSWRPPEMANLFHAAMKNSLLLEIRNCGHLMHEEKPEKFNAAVLEFLHEKKRSS